MRGEKKGHCILKTPLDCFEQAALTHNLFRNPGILVTMPQRPHTLPTSSSKPSIEGMEGDDKTFLVLTHIVLPGEQLTQNMLLLGPKVLRLVTKQDQHLLQRLRSWSISRHIWRGEHTNKCQPNTQFEHHSSEQCFGAGRDGGIPFDGNRMIQVFRHP